MHTAAIYPTNLERFRVPSDINESFYIPNFITPEEEQYLLRKIAESSKVNWRTLPERRLQVWGGEIISNTLIPRPLPNYITDHPPIISRLRSTGVFSTSKHGEPNHIIVNEYHPGQGIMPHEDGPSYHPVVATISLGSHAVFHYHRYRPTEPDDATTTPISDHSGRSIDTRPVLSLLLEPRSLIITAKSLYRDHLHAIEPVEHDIIAPPNSESESDKGYRIANWKLLGDEEMRRVACEGGVLQRKTRVSLTCRDVEKSLPGKGVGFLRT